jgi:hypothetical protein
MGTASRAGVTRWEIRCPGFPRSVRIRSRLVWGCHAGHETLPRFSTIREDPQRTCVGGCHAGHETVLVLR